MLPQVVDKQGSLRSVSAQAGQVFLCQVGTKKILRIYKPFIGGQPPVNGLHFSLCSFAVLCATLLIRRLKRLHHWSDRKLVGRLGQILEPDAILPELSLKPHERGSVPADLHRQHGYKEILSFGFSF